MPIRPENRARYPKDWPLIRERIGVRSEMTAQEMRTAQAAIRWAIAAMRASDENQNPSKQKILRETFDIDEANHEF